MNVKYLLLQPIQHLQMKDKEDLKNRLKELGVEPYRARQLIDAVFKQGITNFSELTTLPSVVRKNISESLPVSSLKIIRELSSRDKKTTKALFETHDGKKIESVLMRFKDGRSTVCVSSQSGCQLGCAFCATGKMGFHRNLTYDEITDQVLYFYLLLQKEKQRISNIVFMGMGEPFLNYDNVMRAVRQLNDKDCFNIGARSITLSTSGIRDGILRLADENIQVNLAVSLHAATQEKREELMPVAKMCRLDDLMEALRFYIGKTNRRVSFEYVMLKDLNDSREDALNLARISRNLLCHINLIPYNATGIKDITGSDKSRIEAFREILEQQKIPVTVRVSLGQDIDAACGQLASKKS